jgi:hypothetical protein
MSGGTLELGLPWFCDDPFEVRTGLIISDIEIHWLSASSQPLHNGVEGQNVVFVGLCLQWLL